MQKYPIKLFVFAQALSLPVVVIATTFQVDNNSSLRGIYITQNNNVPIASNSIKISSPSGASCNVQPNPYKVNNACCLFQAGAQLNSAPLSTVNFTYSPSVPFSITVGGCEGSGVSSQAEFNLNGTECAGAGSCEVVDASLLSNASPSIVITPAGGQLTIQTAGFGTGSNCCGVYTTENANSCNKAPGSCSPTVLCPSGNGKNTAADHCQNSYPAGQSYAVVFR